MFKKIIKDKRVIIISLAILLIFLLTDFNQRMSLLTRLRRHEKELDQRYAQLIATRDALESQLSYAQSDDAVIRWAREDAMLIRDGDVPFIVLAPLDTTPFQTTEPPPIIKEIKPWQIWRELFFWTDPANE